MLAGRLIRRCSMISFALGSQVEVGGRSLGIVVTDLHMVL
jgi:hypothetical protein